MCGRFSLTTDPAELEVHFRLSEVPPVQPRYNIAPTQRVAVVTGQGVGEDRRLRMVQWGLIPFGAGDPSVGTRMINARSETVGEKPSFRWAFEHNRCLVPADGFYEWKRMTNRRQPYYLRLVGHRPFAFAGLWDRWVSPAGEEIESCAILTTAPNDLVRPIHDRMPVMLSREAYDPWLDPHAVPDAIRSLLRPFPSDAMEALPVRSTVNRTDNDGPDCIEAGPAPAELDLFD